MFGISNPLQGIFGGGGTGPSTIQNSSTSTPNQYVSPYITPYLNQAQQLSNSPYVNSTAGFNQNQTDAQGMIANRATSGNSLYDTGAQTLQNTAAGNNLDPKTNPYLQSTMDAATGQVRGSLGSTFSGNNFGSSAHEQLMNQQTTQAIAPMLMQNYNQGINNQMQASMAAPGYAAAGYNDANQLMGVGNQQQANTQQQLTNQVNDPYKKLGVMGNAVNIGFGGGNNTSSTGTNPNQGSGAANNLGLLGMGAGIGNMMGWWGG